MFKGLLFFVKTGWKYDKCYILWRVFYQFVNSLIPIMTTLLPKYIIDELLGEKNASKLIFYIATLVGYTLIATMLSHFFNLDGFTRRVKVAAEFDSEIHRLLTETDFDNLENPDFLDMQEKARKFLYCDYHGFGYLLDRALDIVGQSFTLIGISTIIATFDFKIVLLFIIFVVLSSLIEGKAKKKALSLNEAIVKDNRGWCYYADLFQDFTYGKEIRLNSMGNFLLSKERTYFTRVNENLRQQNSCYIHSGFWGAVFTGIQQLAAYAYLTASVVKGTISIGSFTMYTGAVTSFSKAFRTVLDSLIEIRAYDMYYDRLDEYISLPTKCHNGKLLPAVSTNHTIEFRNVSFRYPGSTKYALRNINLILSSEQKLSIVGENGAGKTTFVKLLTRLYEPTEGEILLDGINIQQISYDSYMALFSTVFQDYKLFSLSLLENVALALPIDEASIQELLEYVGLGEKIQKLPNGIHTSVYKNFDESGFEPSGGEGQKIALARALYKNAPIVILDEPTAALDPRAEFEMYQHFNEMMQGKTAVYISHRLSSSRFCDRIAVFQNGTIVEYGTHEELMSQGRLYKELYDMQAQFYIR